MRAILGLAAALAAGIVQAATPASWLTLDYAQTDLEFADGGGYVLAGGWQFSEHWFVAGRYGQSELDIAEPRPNRPSQADWEYLRAGLGYRTSFSPKLDWFALLSYDRVDLTVVEDEAESGQNFETGISYGLNDQITLGGSISYQRNNTEQDIDLFDGDIGFFLRGAYALTPRFGLGASYEQIDNFDEWRIGVVANF